MPLVYMMTFVLGALMGSFLNVVGLRFLREESIIWPGSHCYSCNTAIKPYDNIPVISWLLLRGKCRHCKTPISIQYPLIEFLTGSLFVAIVANYGFTLQAGFLIYLVCNLMVILITDFREQYIYDMNSIGLIPFGLAYNWLNLGQIPVTASGVVPFTGLHWTVPEAFASALAAVVGAFVLFFVLNLLSRLMIGRPGFGEGDTRLLMGLGAFFGVKWMIMIFVLSFAIQAGIGIPMILRQWALQHAYKPIGLFSTGLTLAVLPYGAQVVVTDSMLILLIAVLCAPIAMICAMKALKQAQSLPTGLTYLPFGPAIVAACLLMLFFSEPIIQVFQRFWAI